MLDVIDLGVFPAVDRSYFWLTIALPIIAYVILCILTARSKVKEDTAGNIYFIGFMLTLFITLFGSIGTSVHLDNVREDKIIAAVQDAGFTNVVEVADSWIADISAVDKDGNGYLFDFIELPGNHVGLLEVKGDQ